MINIVNIILYESISSILSSSIKSPIGLIKEKYSKENKNVNNIDRERIIITISSSIFSWEKAIRHKPTVNTEKATNLVEEGSIPFQKLFQNRKNNVGPRIQIIAPMYLKQ